MIHKPPPFKSLNIRIAIIIPIKGRGFINHGSGLAFGGLRSCHCNDIGTISGLGRVYI